MFSSLSPLAGTGGALFIDFTRLFHKAFAALTNRPFLETGAGGNFFRTLAGTG